MKKLLFSLILSLSIISISFKIEANNKALSALAGSPFYATSIYCFHKLKTCERSRGTYSDILNIFFLDIPLAGGGTIAGLSGVLTSVLTYNVLNKKLNK